MPVAAIVEFRTRPGGNEVRVRQWCSLLSACGYEVVRCSVRDPMSDSEIGVVARHGRIQPGFGHVRGVLSGWLPLESLAWSRRALRRRLAQCHPDLLVFVTLRAYDPVLASGVGSVVVDFVDRLSASYRQRADIEKRRLHAVGFYLLSWATRRCEDRGVPSGFLTVAAGRIDAADLGARWLPLLVLPPTSGGGDAGDPLDMSAVDSSGDGETIRLADIPATDPVTSGSNVAVSGAYPLGRGKVSNRQSGSFASPPSHNDRHEPSRVIRVERYDLLFVGTLDYLPNIASLRALSSLVWPALQSRRPGTSLLVAGRRPTAEVRGLVGLMGASLVEDFAVVDDVTSRSVICIVPLPVASGMQTKMVETAVRSMAIVATPPAMNGVDEQFPAVVAPLGMEFVDAVIALLDNPVEAQRLGAAARSHVQATYSLSRWVPIVTGWLHSPPLAAKGPPGL